MRKKCLTLKAERSVKSAYKYVQIIKNILSLYLKEICTLYINLLEHVVTWWRPHLASCGKKALTILFSSFFFPLGKDHSKLFVTAGGRSKLRNFSVIRFDRFLTETGKYDSFAANKV